MARQAHHNAMDYEEFRHSANNKKKTVDRKKEKKMRNALRTKDIDELINLEN